MSVNVVNSGARMTAYLSGEIDHHNAPEIRSAIDAAALKERPAVLRLDFRDVSFMDSSGVGLVMGRYKLVSGFSGRIEVAYLSGSCERVMKLSGIEKIATLIK